MSRTKQESIELKVRITARAAYAVQRLHDKLTGGEGKWDASRLLKRSSQKEKANATR